MAVHKYIEQNDLVSEFRFAGSVCGSGPYDPIATLQKYIQTNEVYMPVAVGMMLYSMCETNPRLMGKFEPKDYLTKKFLDSGIIELIEAKKLNTDQMQVPSSPDHADGCSCSYWDRNCLRAPSP